MCEPDPACEEEWISRYFYTVVSSYDSCRDANCDFGPSAIGEVSIRWTVTARVEDFDFAGEVWKSVGTDEVYSNEGCARNCGFPTPTIFCNLYQPGSGPGVVYNPGTDAGPVGLNYLTIRGYSFKTSTGYGQTKEEASANAAAGVPS